MLLGPGWMGEEGDSSHLHTLSSIRTRAPRVSSSRRQSLGLPIEIWSRIFRHVHDVPTLGQIARVCKAWNGEFQGSKGDKLWRDVWEHETGSSEIPEWARSNRDGWRGEVAASRLVRFQRAKTVVTLPALSNMSYFSDVVAVDSLEFHGLRTKITDAEEALGDPHCVEVLGSGLCFIGFEKGIGILNTGSRPGLDFSFRAIGNVIKMSKFTSSSDSVLVMTRSKEMFKITALKDPTKSPLVEKICELHVWLAHAIELVVSEDDRFACIGCSNGTLHVADLTGKKGLQVFSMRESIDLLGVGHTVVAGSNFLGPVAVTVWDVMQGRALHRFSQTSVGWEEIYQVSGVLILDDKHLLVWDGKHLLITVDVRSGKVIQKFSAHYGSPPQMHYIQTAPRIRSYHCQNALKKCSRRNKIVGFSGVCVYTIDVGNPIRAEVLSIAHHLYDPLGEVTSDGNGLVVADISTSLSGPMKDHFSRCCLRTLDSSSTRSSFVVRLPHLPAQLSVAANIVAVLDKRSRYVAVFMF